MPQLLRIEYCGFGSLPPGFCDLLRPLNAISIRGQFSAKYVIVAAREDAALQEVETFLDGFVDTGHRHFWRVAPEPDTWEVGPTGPILAHLHPHPAHGASR